MAVNENLYRYIFDRYGMGAAEWYRSNPTKPSGSNPFLPKGTYVPQAKKNTPGEKGPRGETLASVSPEIIEESIIEPAAKPAETEDQRFERFYNQAKQQYESSKKPAPTYSQAEFPSAKLGPNISYMPEFGQYGGYFSKEDLRPLTSLLYNKFQDVYKNLPSPYDPGNEQMLGAAIIRNNPGLAPDYDHNHPQTLAQLKRYDEMMAARNNAFKQYYEIPLAQAKYKSTAEAPSRAAYRQQLVDMGFEIPLVEGYTYFERAATPEDYEPQYYGLENVGRSDFRQQRANAAILKNFEILEQQAKAGNQNSQEFLNQYKAESQAASESEPARGPRGEILGDVAQNQGPSTPVKYDEQMKMFVPNQGGGRPGNVRLKQPPPFAQGPRGEEMVAQNQGPSTPVKYDEHMKMFVPNQGGGRPANVRPKIPLAQETQEPAFDEQRALIAAQAAGAYRKRGDVEDPFRSGAFG